MHNLKFLRRRFGKRSESLIALLFMLSLSGLGIGLGLLLVIR